MMNQSIADTAMLTGQHLYFSCLTVESGLSHNVGNDMVQDAHGFIWISTSDGLNRFDGYEIRAFQHDPGDPYSLSTNHIRGMTMDSAGFIWIATAGGGLNRFDPRTETFTRYLHQPGDSNSLGFDFAVSVFVDREGMIWIGGFGAVDRFDPETGTFVHHRHDPNDPTTIGPGQVHSICQDEDGALWFGNRGGGGLSRFTGPTGSTGEQRSSGCVAHFVHYWHDPDDPRSISDDSIQVVHVDRDGDLWVGTENGGLSRFDRATETFCRYQHDPRNPDSISSDYVRDIMQDQSGHLWIGTAGGLNHMDRASGVFTHYRHDPANPSSISTDSISRVFEDRAGGLWVTTFRGANYCYPKHQRFRRYRHEPRNPNSLDDDSVRAIYEDGSGTLWIGTEKGLNRYDRARGQFTRYQHDPENPASLSPCLFVMAIVEDADHKLWIGTWGGELNCFDPRSGRFWRPGDDPDCPRIRDVLALWRDHDQNIWVGAYNQGLYCFVNSPPTDCLNPSRPRFVHYSHDLDLPHSLSANTVGAIYEDRDNVLWVGTDTGGLNRFVGSVAGVGTGLSDTDREDMRAGIPAARPRARGADDGTRGTFVQYCHDPQDPASLSNNWVASILQDRAGNLWVGTRNGLNRLDRETGSFFHYGERDGMPNPTVVGILEDTFPADGEQAHLWMSTNQGLVKFNPRTETFQSYGVAAGIQLNSDVGGFCRSRSGEMFFGGYGGVTGFWPGQIIDNQDTPPVVITDFLLFNKPVPIGGDSPLRQAIWATDEIALSDQDYSFAFEFAALSYVDPRKNRYKFKLEGFDQDWHEVDSQRRHAAYTNLPAGEYVFWVLGSNNHRVWNEEGASIKIKVAQPVWERLRLEKEAAEAANMAKADFLANMSHELRTPLNAILGYSQLMARDPQITPTQQEYLETMAHSGEHLLSLINDVLTMSKIEAGRTTLQENGFDLHRQLRGLQEMFQVRADDKGLALRLDITEGVPRYVYADEVKLRQVLMNLLSNAVKFTEEGSVTLRVEVRDQGPGFEHQRPGTDRQTPVFILFEVEDTGAGIAPEEMDVLFDPFVQTASGQQSREGTGLGLPISRQFIELMGGDLDVSSIVGQSTIFRMRIPVGLAGADMVEALDLQSQRRVTGIEPGQTAPDGGPFRLLIVEDKLINRDLLIRLLMPFGFDMRYGVDGAEGVEMWETWQPHLVWMDMRMPVMDGHEATRQIKARAAATGRTAIIIALTASAFEEDREAILAAGCDGFVRKPFREREIFDVLHRYLGVRFIYEKATPAPEAAASVSLEDLRAELETLPGAWAADLYQAIIGLNYDRMLALIESVRPQSPRLSDTLAKWVRDFEYERLLALVAPET